MSQLDTGFMQGLQGSIALVNTMSQRRQQELQQKLLQQELEYNTVRQQHAMQTMAFQQESQLLERETHEMRQQAFMQQMAEAERAGDQEAVKRLGELAQQAGQGLDSVMHQELGDLMEDNPEAATTVARSLAERLVPAMGVDAGVKDQSIEFLQTQLMQGFQQAGQQQAAMDADLERLRQMTRGAELEADNMERQLRVTPEQRARITAREQDIQQSFAEEQAIRQQINEVMQNEMLEPEQRATAVEQLQEELQRVEGSREADREFIFSTFGQRPAVPGYMFGPVPDTVMVNLDGEQHAVTREEFQEYWGVPLTDEDWRLMTGTEHGRRQIENVLLGRLEEVLAEQETEQATQPAPDPRAARRLRDQQRVGAQTNLPDPAARRRGDPFQQNLGRMAPAARGTYPAGR